VDSRRGSPWVIPVQTEFWEQGGKSRSLDTSAFLFWNIRAWKRIHKSGAKVCSVRQIHFVGVRVDTATFFWKASENTRSTWICLFCLPDGERYTPKVLKLSVMSSRWISCWVVLWPVVRTKVWGDFQVVFSRGRPFTYFHDILYHWLFWRLMAPHVE